MKLLDSKTLKGIKSLELKTHLILEGFFAGAHKGNFIGYNLEFIEHRPYSPGDDLRYLNWKIFGKQDKLFLKKFEEETNLKIYIFLDISNSMAYKGENTATTKLEYATLLSAAIFYLAFLQTDYFSLTTFFDKINSFFPLGNNKNFLTKIFQELENIKPQGRTNFSNPLKEHLAKVNKRGLYIVISDFWEEPQTLLTYFNPLMKLKNEVIFFHILDNNELNFKFKGNFTFVDLETQDEINFNSAQIKSEYEKAMQNRIKYFQQKSKLHYFNYLLLNTESPFIKPLSLFLMARKKGMINK